MFHLFYPADGSYRRTLFTDDAPSVPLANVHSQELQVRAEVDQERQKQARRYARQRQALSLVNLCISSIVVLVLLFTGLSFRLRDALSALAVWQPLTDFAPLQIGAFVLVLLITAFVFGLPLSYYSGFTLPHRYGLSTQSLRGWITDTLKGQTLSLPLELIAVVFIYALLAITPNLWWLWAACAILCFTALLSNLAPILLVPIFYKLTPLPEGDLRERTLSLAQQAHTRVHGIYSMNMSARTTAANAMVMGLGATRRIVLGDTLIDHYTPDEIEVVVAHELGHQVHNDIPKLIAVETVTMLVGLFIVNLVLHAIVSANLAYHGLTDPATLPLIAAALGIFALITMPMTNGYSRHVEHQADVYALKSTGKTQAFMSAMTRLANQNLAELEPAPVIEFLLYDHPSLGKRIAYARHFANETPVKK